MEAKKIETGEIKCGFGIRKTYEGRKGFDKDYVSLTIKKVAKNTGQKDVDGDDICVLEDKVIETRKPIKDVINADADNCGIDAYLKPFLLSGTEPNVHFDKDAPIQDFTKCPQDLAGASELSRKAAMQFDALPEELKCGAKTLDEFFNGFTQEKFMSYIDKISKKVPNKSTESEVK